MPLSRRTPILNLGATNFYAVGLYKKYEIILEWRKLLVNKSTKFRQKPILGGWLSQKCHLGILHKACDEHQKFSPSIFVEQLHEN